MQTVAGISHAKTRNAPIPPHGHCCRHRHESTDFSAAVHDHLQYTRRKRQAAALRRGFLGPVPPEARDRGEGGGATSSSAAAANAEVAGDSDGSSYSRIGGKEEAAAGGGDGAGEEGALAGALRRDLRLAPGAKLKLQLAVLKVGGGLRFGAMSRADGGGGGVGDCSGNSLCACVCGACAPSLCGTPLRACSNVRFIGVRTLTNALPLAHGRAEGRNWAQAPAGPTPPSMRHLRRRCRLDRHLRPLSSLQQRRQHKHSD